MAFTKVSGARTYFKYKECEQGQKLVDDGLYIGEEQGKFGVQHIFRQKDKKTVVLNSAGHLNWLLENYTTPGKTHCNVIYDKRVKLTKGAMAGKEAHTFELEVDDGGEFKIHSDAPEQTGMTAYQTGDDDADITL